MPWDGSLTVDQVWRSEPDGPSGFEFTRVARVISLLDAVARSELLMVHADLAVVHTPITPRVSFVRRLLDLELSIWEVASPIRYDDVSRPVDIRSRLTSARSADAAARTAISRLTPDAHRKLRKELAAQCHANCVRRLDCLYSMASKLPWRDSAAVNVGPRADEPQEISGSSVA
jgi:hypothetical protein